MEWLCYSCAITSNFTTPRISEWKTQNYDSIEMSVNMKAIFNLVRESKIHGVNGTEIWKTMMTHKRDIQILNPYTCINETQIRVVIYKTGHDLKLNYDMASWIPEEDLAFGTELYSALYYCPEELAETMKLSVFFESLLANHKLTTVVAATMHNIQPRAVDNIKNFAEINEWYKRLDERYNFSLGEVLLPLMTNDNMRTLEELAPPFMEGIVNRIDVARYNISSSRGNSPVHSNIDFFLNRRAPINIVSPTTSDFRLGFRLHTILRL